MSLPVMSPISMTQFLGDVGGGSQNITDVDIFVNAYVTNESKVVTVKFEDNRKLAPDEVLDFTFTEVWLRQNLLVEHYDVISCEMKSADDIDVYATTPYPVTYIDVPQITASIKGVKEGVILDATNNSPSETYTLDIYLGLMPFRTNEVFLPSTPKQMLITTEWMETNAPEVQKGDEIFVWIVREGTIVIQTNSILYGVVRPCFIATVAYGTPLAPQLNKLRQFRDRCLPKTLTSLYYAMSPPIAEKIERNPRLKFLTRTILDILL